MSLLEMFQHELDTHGITWCQGKDCKWKESQHRNRAFATSKTRTVHMLSQVAQRSTLLDGLHEIGHIVANTPGMRRWQKEKTATEWAYQRMKALGVAIPRKSRKDYNDYVARMKGWGKNISAGRKGRRPKPPKQQGQTSAVRAAKRAVARIETEAELFTVGEYLNYRRNILRDRRAQAEVENRWKSILALPAGARVSVTRHHYNNLPPGTFLEVVGPEKRSMVLKWNDKRLRFGPTDTAKCGLEVEEWTHD